MMDENVRLARLHYLFLVMCWALVVRRSARRVNPLLGGQGFFANVISILGITDS
jgi:hypothetical protein